MAQTNRLHLENVEKRALRNSKTQRTTICSLYTGTQTSRYKGVYIFITILKVFNTITRAKHKLNYRHTSFKTHRILKRDNIELIQFIGPHYLQIK